MLIIESQMNNSEEFSRNYVQIVIDKLETIKNKPSVKQEKLIRGFASSLAKVEYGEPTEKKSELPKYLFREKNSYKAIIKRKGKIIFKFQNLRRHVVERRLNDFLFENNIVN